jgi:nucleoid DNA-binding protein
MSKFTRTNLREILKSEAGLGPVQAREVAGRIIEAMAAALAAGETVELRGLGTFESRERKPRKAHNPRTLAPVFVPAHKVIVFRPCGKLKKVVSAIPEKPYKNKTRR